MAEQADVVVVGLGVGGEAVATRLAEAGLSVVGIEPRLVGGECPYYGCVPTKMMVRAANLLAEARRVPGIAGRASVEPDWAPVARRIREEATDSWNDAVAVRRLVDKGVRVRRGTGRLVGPDRVAMAVGTVSRSGDSGGDYDGDGDGEIHAKRGIVIGTGTAPVIPSIDGLAGTPFWTNREAVQVQQLPRSLIVLGGGAVGVELAQVFARFGVAVSMLETGDRILAAEEPEASALAADTLAADGVAVRTGIGVAHVAHDGGEFTLTLTAGHGTVSASALLVATGRRADLDGLGLDAAGPEVVRRDLSGRFLAVDSRLRVADRIWAVGDITGRGAFTHVAVYQAGIAAADILGEDRPPADYRAVPRVTFTDPEIGAVGLTERQAREAGLSVRVGVGQVPRSSRGWIHKAGNAGFIKIIVDRARGVLVGATSAGPVGGEVLSALAMAVHAELPVATLHHMIYAYPTFHRGMLDALRDLG